MFGKKPEFPLDEKESPKITERLDQNEKIIMSVRQSRVKPGGAAGINPNTIFVTEKRIIIRNPIRLGFGEHIEEYFYKQITNVRLEKGLFSSSLVFYIPGMTEMSKQDRKFILWGRDSEGTIDAIPKDKAEVLYTFIKEKIKEAKLSEENTKKPTTQTDPLTILKERFVKGEITEEEFTSKKKILES
ncbi:MAG: PH domain-containing protein [Nitrosopumilaceae archaeon]|nr:PH domain-containing protein [Nitrosopumilaceae archaeon]